MTPTASGLKLLLAYDVQADNLDEYYQFVLGRYIPVMEALGLQMIGAWHTAYGDWPNRLVEFATREEDVVHSLLGNETWASLNEQLSKYVANFSYKVVPYREGFQF